LVGRGKPIGDHSGNIRLRHLALGQCHITKTKLIAPASRRKPRLP
jgi:hypothetical protein